MSNVRANYLLLKSCLSKKAFETSEEAYTPHHTVYRCRVCKKWHRTSKPDYKEHREKQEQARNQQRAQNKRQKKKLSTHTDSDLVRVRAMLVEAEGIVLFTRTPTVPNSYRTLLNAIKAEKKLALHICMEKENDAFNSLHEFVVANELRSFSSYFLSDNDGDQELRIWGQAIKQRLFRAVGWKNS